MPSLIGRVPVSGRIAVPPTLGLVLWLRADSGVTVSDAVITFPTDFTNAIWDKRRTSVVAGATLDPFGGMLGTSLIEDNTNNTHLVLQFVNNLVTAKPITYTVYAKAGARTWAIVGDAALGNPAVWFDLANGVMGATIGTVLARSITPFGNGWYRLSVTGVMPNNAISIYMTTADGVGGYAGDGVSNIFIYGAGVSQQKVSAWADQSGWGHNVTQVTAANQPLLVGAAENASLAVRFGTSGGESLQSAAFGLNQPEDVFAVARVITQGSAGVRDIGWDGFAAGSMVLGNIFANTVAISAGAAVSYTGADLAFPAYDYFECQYDGPASVVSTHGIPLGPVGNVGTNNAGGFTLGGLANGTRGLNAEYTEILIYNRILNDAERTQLNNYLRWRYDIAQPMPFLPPELSGLALWLRADLGITLNSAVLVSPNDLTNAAWSKVQVTAAFNATTDPFGGTNASSLTEDNNAGFHYALNIIPVGTWAAGPATLSIYAKAGTRNWLYLAGNGIGEGSYFNLATGAVGTAVGTITSRSMIDAGNGWYLCSVTLPTVANNLWAAMAIADAGVAPQYAGNGTGHLFLAGATFTQEKVSAWADQSGSANDVAQGTAASQPLWFGLAQNGKPTVRFTAASMHFLKKAATNLFGAGNYSLFGLAVWSASGTPRQIIFGDTDAATGGMFYGPTDPGVTGSREVGYIGSIDQVDAVMSKTAEEFDVRYGGGADTTLRVNGTAHVLAPLAAMLNPGGGAAIRLGTYNDAALFYDGDIAEIIAYTRKLTDAEAATVEAYLLARYGLTVPLSIPNLVAWYRADQGITLGTGVQQWNDISGNGNHLTQFSPGAQPSLIPAAYNGQPCVRFASAGNQQLSRFNTDLIGTGAYSLVLVVRIRSSTGANGLFGNMNAGAGSVLFLNAGPVRDVLHVGAVAFDDGPIQTVAPEIWTVTRAVASNPLMRIDGISQALAGAGGINAPGPTGRIVMGAYWLGAFTGFADIDVLEAMIFNRDLTTTEDTQVEAYLRSRYGWPTPPVPNPVLWLRADMGITLNGSNVSTWADQSGNGNNAVQAVPGNQPAYSAAGFNGHPCVDWGTGAVSRGLTVPSLTLGRNTVIGAIREDAVGGYFVVFNNDITNGFYIYGITGFAFDLNRAGVDSGYNVVTNWLSDGVPRTVSVNYGGTHATHFSWRNGTPDVDVSTVAGEPGSGVATGPLYLGNNQAGAGQYKGVMAEVLVYDRSLTTAELTVVHAYLKSKYGL
jgi:hypothetical protein